MTSSKGKGFSLVSPQIRPLENKTTFEARDVCQFDLIGIENEAKGVT